MSPGNRPHLARQGAAVLVIVAVRMDCWLRRLGRRFHLGQCVLLTQKIVVSRGLGVGRIGILRGCFGTRGLAFVGCIFAMAVHAQ